MLRVALALLIPLVLGNTANAAAKASGWSDPFADGGEEAECPAPVAAPAKSKAKAPAKKTRASSRRARHKVPGSVVADSRLRDTPLPRPSGNLHLYRVSGEEDLKVNLYNEDGSYDVNAVSAVSRILRCKRTETVKDMDPRLMTLLSHVYDHFGERKLEVVSGYRNQQRTSSFHYQGSATDIRIPGITPKKLRAFIETLDEGGMGIGLYPRSRFVHIDVRPPPSYRWIDYSRPEPDSPDKRPPRNFKRKKLQS